MCSSSAKRNAMIFETGTTYNTDYPWEYGAKAVCLPTSAPLTKPLQAKPVPELLKDIHTMGVWKKHVPFSIWHRPKEIVRTKPHHHFNPYVYPVESQESERKKVQKTRPRLLITPAVAIDDLEDEERQNLIKHTYKTTSELFLSSAVPEKPPVLAPLPGTLAPPVPLSFPKSRPLYVSPEWRMESAAWDGRQVRADCYTSKEFWSRRPEPSCTPCKQSALMRAHRRANVL